VAFHRSSDWLTQNPCAVVRVRVRVRWVNEGSDDSAWTRLAGLNAQMIGHFRRLNALADERRAAYESTLERLAALPADQVPSHACIPDILLQLSSPPHTHAQWRAQGDGADEVVVTQLLALRAALVEVRRNLKLMGDLSGAAIEPDVQTQVCDATMALPGVLLAGVPGGPSQLPLTSPPPLNWRHSLPSRPSAGGMDALFAVALGATAQAAVCPLSPARVCACVGVCGVVRKLTRWLQQTGAGVVGESWYLTAAAGGGPQGSLRPLHGPLCRPPAP
jgi:hypothetical protein